MWNSIFNLYNDELLYCALGRLGALYGFRSCKEYISMMYGTENLVPTLWFPGRLDYWTKKFPIGIKMTSDYIIREHTMYQLYAPFMDIDTQKYVLRKMKDSYAGGITHKIGIVAGGVCKKRYLYFCPECSVEEFETLGEAYFHRIHQAEGVLVCEKHGRILIPLKQLGKSKFEFCYLSRDNVLQGHVADSEVEYYDLVNWINEQFRYLLNNDLGLNKGILHDIYLKRLKDMGLALPSGSIRQRELYQLFTEYYPKDFLRLLESDINYEKEYNWLKVITRNSKRSSHPLRHILLIGFLFGSVEELIEYVKSTKRSKDKFPCLNPTCENYLKLAISDVVLTYDYKTKKAIGTFRCSCGFIYSRDMSKIDIYSLGRIKEFGSVWKNELIEQIDKGKSISEISKVLKCDKKTVIRQSLLLGLGGSINTKYKTIADYNSRYNSQNPKNPKTKTDLRNDTPGSIEIKEDKLSNKRVDWGSRDVEILEEIKGILPILYSRVRKTRVSKTRICNHIDKYSVINYNSSKLPKTTKFIEDNIESLLDFQCFRVDRACEDILQQGLELTRWRIIRKAGLKEPINEIVENQIQKWT